MTFTRVHLEALGYELAPNVISTASLEERLAPVYKKLFMQLGQLESLTGIRERRWWDAGFTNAEGATRAALKALEGCDVKPSDLGALAYCGVCRDHQEPATACAVAHNIGVTPETEIYDVSNACIGALNGMLNIAQRIELGQIRAGMIVSCESAREITGVMIEHMLNNPTMDVFKTSLATLTGGSGAIGIILTDGSFASERPALKGAIAMAAPEHHQLCSWDVGRLAGNGADQHMMTDSIAVLNNGAILGEKTWNAMLKHVGWKHEDVDRAFSHQIGIQHRNVILKAIKLDPAKEYSTFEYLGNIGTVSLPITAAIAAERGFVSRGHKVGFFGIGSGLNCIMMGWEW